MTIFHSVHMARTLRRAAHIPPALLYAPAACRRLLLTGALALVVATPALAQSISTVAGVRQGSGGDGGPATAAELMLPQGVTQDALGNLYIADRDNHRVRKVTPAGTISTVAGTGGMDFSGDGGPATAAQMRDPGGVAVDAAGNLYIADTNNHRIRKVTPAGTISTVAGVAGLGFSGDGGPATAAHLFGPVGVAVDAAGNLYIADTRNNRIRKVDSAGDIHTVAGTGTSGSSGDGGSATLAQLSGPMAVAVDAAGNLYIADGYNNRIRKVDSAGDIHTVAGTGIYGSSGDGGSATVARLGNPYGVAVDAAGNLYISDSGNHRIRKVDSAGTIHALAGTGTSGFSGDGGPAAAAQFFIPYGVSVDAAGNTLYIADLNNNRIRKVSAVPPNAPTAVTAVAGNAQAMVSWTAPVGTGGQPITGYAVTAVEDTTKTCTPTPATATTCTVATLANGTAYTFTVVAANTLGNGTASAPSTAVTPMAVPGAPTAVTAVAGNAQATVSWTAPLATGGGAIASYTVTSTPAGSCTVAAPATSCVVPTLANGSAHTFTVVASNALWPSLASAPSTAVTPLGVPGAPTAVTAVAGNAQATVSWTAPVATGGGPIANYTVTGAPAGTCTVAAPATSCVVPTLANGTAHTFTVVASNALWPSVASGPSTAVTPRAPVVNDPGPVYLPITSPGTTTTITDPSQPIVVGPNAGGAMLLLPGTGTGTAPVPLQITVNGQAMQVQATPGSYLRIAQVNGQNVLMLEVIQGWASMASTTAGQPMARAGGVLLSSGSAGTRIEAQPMTVAVLSGSLVPPQGSLPELGDKGLLAGEKLQVNEQGALVSIIVGSLSGTAGQAGDAMGFYNLPTSIVVDGKSFARLDAAVARLAGTHLAQGLEIAPTGVILLRADGAIYQLLPVQPIRIDATLPDGIAFTPLGLLRWVQGGVVVQLAPAVADLAGLATAVTAALPGASLKLGTEGVLQLNFGGATYVLKPDWTGAGMAAGAPQIGMDQQGRIAFQVGTGPRQLLLPALLNTTQANSIFTTAIPGSVLAVQPGSSEGALTLTLAGQRWSLVPHWVLPAGDAASQNTSWRMGADGLVYLKLGNQVQGVRIVD